MVKEVIGVEKFLAAAGTGSGSGNTIGPILQKLGTFARAVCRESYGIEESFANQINLTFPLIGINHLVLRGIFEPLERLHQGVPDAEKAGKAGLTADKADENPDFFFEHAEHFFSKEGLDRLKECLRISNNVTNAEIDSRSLTQAISAHDLSIATAALEDINTALQKLAVGHPDQQGLKNMATDFATVTTHYQALALTWQNNMQPPAPSSP